MKWLEVHGILFKYKSLEGATIFPNYFFKRIHGIANNKY